MSTSHEAETKKYIKSHSIDRYIKSIMRDCLKQKPEDIYTHILKFCQNQLKNKQKDSLKNLTENSSDEESKTNFENDIKAKKAKAALKGNQVRIGICAEGFGVNNGHDKEFQPRIIPKSDQDIEQIKKVIIKNFCFSSLDKKELKMVIDAMEIKSYKKDQFLIKQGEKGDEMFIVGTGTLKCTKRMDNQSTDTFLKNYGSGDVFGELALMYNVPRAANIIANSDVIAYALDRDTFNKIVKGASIKKREKQSAILKKISFLKNLNQEEIDRICDCLISESFDCDEMIIKQGDVGEKLYFIMDGTAEVWKSVNGKNEKFIVELKEGDFFGEVALIKTQKRDASVKAGQNGTTLASLDKESFKRLLGKFETDFSKSFVKYNLK